MADTLKSIGHIAVTAVNTGTGMIGKAIDAVGETFSTAAGFVSNLPYIVAGGVVLVAGFQVYHYNKRGKFYGEDTAKKLIEKKAGLGDGGEKSTDYTEVGEITPELAALINRPAGKIFITKAVINHIRNNHRKQIHRYTDKDILNYIINILCKINEIREGYDGALILAHRGKKTEDLVIVEECVLEFVDGAYIVKTAFRSKVKDLQNKKLIMCGKNAKKF